MITPAHLAAYHGPSPLGVVQVFTAWRVDPVVLAIVLLTAAWYLRAVRGLRRDGGSWPRARTISFVALGLGSYLLVKSSFLGVYQDTLFWPRAVQNIWLLMVTPLMLALGAPVTLLLATLSPAARGRVEAVLHSRPARFVTFPLISSALLIATPITLYFSPWYELSLRNGVVDGLLHVQLVLTGFLYFWSRLQLDPVPREYPQIVSVWLTFAEVILDASLAVTLALTSHLVAGDHYLALARDWGPSPHVDQVIGAGCLWLIGDLAGLPFLVALLRRMMRQDEAEAVAIDEELDRRAAEEAGEPVPPGDAPAPVQQTMKPWWEDDPAMAERFRRGR
ncbi:cytochrome c oxidase assembly protein [Solihabitans fulvus]|uniref:Cytochrome c oxidase assembly protein n=1 Tax=Solihabitans fulvus TaxID=1892852 RepID=A0A5B2X5L5_9PSEU|nr:cytochrome c oxidase assembly protein [Solihabitans fulvus]KAA2258637.1 cytochrome c oxidase assembly protein [Solihabitans fulvus]